MAPTTLEDLVAIGDQVELKTNKGWCKGVVAIISDGTALVEVWFGPPEARYRLFHPIWFEAASPTCQPSSSPPTIRNPGSGEEETLTFTGRFRDGFAPIRVSEAE